MKKLFGVKEVVAAGIGTAIFVALTQVQIPIAFIPNTSLQPRTALLAFFAAIFGPVVGGVIGLLGHALGDALAYGSVWWSWVFPEALLGIVIGLFSSKFQIKEGGFKGKQVILFNIVQIAANALAWALLAPGLDILIYSEPVNKVFVQGIIAMISNIIVVGILGTLIGVAYTQIGAKAHSLTKED